MALTVSKIKLLQLTKTTATKFLKNFLPEKGAPSKLTHKKKKQIRVEEATDIHPEEQQDCSYQGEALKVPTAF